MKKNGNVDEFEVVGYYRTTKVFRVDPSKCAKESNLSDKIHMVGFGFIAFLGVSAMSAVSFLF